MFCHLEHWPVKLVVVITFKINSVNLTIWPSWSVLQKIMYHLYHVGWYYVAYLLKQENEKWKWHLSGHRTNDLLIIDLIGTVLENNWIVTLILKVKSNWRMLILPFLYVLFAWWEAHAMLTLQGLHVALWTVLVTYQLISCDRLLRMQICWTLEILQHCVNVW